MSTTPRPDNVAPREHYLKTWPEFYGPIESGKKPFEIRKNDRSFEVGDTLVLMEWNPETGLHTGRQCVRRITYMTPFAQPDGQVVMGLEEPLPFGEYETEWLAEWLIREFLLEEYPRSTDDDLREEEEWFGSLLDITPVTRGAASSLAEERDKLLAFKQYVHDRLDKAGIPADPDSPHKAEGCRIGGRLDIALARKDWPEEPTDTLLDILGRPCFTFIEIAAFYRRAGIDIPRSAENEQAFFLHNFVGHWFQHGDKWADGAKAEIASIRAMIEAKEGKAS